MSREAALARYLERFARAEATLPGARLGWLAARRRQAVERLRAVGFPGRRDEDWRFTDVAPLLALPFDAEPSIEIAIHAPAGVHAERLAPALEREPSRLEPWLGRIADAEASGFAALNAALFHDGVVIRIEPGARPEQPIDVRVRRRGAQPPRDAQLRVLVLAGAGSRATVVERYEGDGVYWNSVVSELAIERGAELEHVRVQRESAAAFHVATLAAVTPGAGRFVSRSFALGGALARADIGVRLDAEGAECELDGLYLAGGRQLVDHHTSIEHAQPHTTSRELYQGILAGRGHAVFRGRVHVHPGAQKTDAVQTNRNLLLSDDAQIHTKPQLEIYADDVKCAHGASVGRLDEQALFYLRTRGIDAAQARSILTLAFARQVLGRLPDEALRAELEREVERWLAATQEEGAR
jgi:Fe-S cluster assembly protein SufD